MTADLKQSANLAGKLLASGRVALTTATTVYTVPNNSAAAIKTGVLCNTSTNPVTVSVAVVPSGGTDDGTHTVMSSYSLAANDSMSIDEIKGDLWDAGVFLSLTCSVGGVVCYKLSGAVSS